MTAYLALLKVQLQLAFRERIVMFFNYVFPLVFFFMFGTFMDAGKSVGAAQNLVAMVLSIGILGNGLFGLGLRAVQDRQQDVLRRLHLAPISAAPIVFATMASGILVYLPAALLTIFMAKWFYHMPLPSNLGVLLLFVCVANLAFRAIGMIIGAVANTMAEAQILVQILYFPMLFLSGMSYPLNALPHWAQIFSRFIPATYVTSGFQSIIQNGESLGANMEGVAALLLTTVIGCLISYELFRWDKDDPVSGKAKIWIVGVLLPFVVLGVWESRQGTFAAQQAITYRQSMRNRNWHIRDVRVFSGDGPVIERADVYASNGKIVHVVEEGQPAPQDANNYEVIEGAGKTLMPGLIDVHTHLGGPPIITGEMEPEFSNLAEHALEAYLYCGVTAVKSVGDNTDATLKLRARERSGELLGSELFMVGPLFTAPGGHGTEYAKYLPEMMRQQFENEMAAAYKTPAEAVARVDTLAGQGVDGIKVVLESGAQGSLFERLDLNVFDAIVKAAAAHQLPVVVHTGDLQDVSDAMARNVSGVEHGAMRELMPASMIEELARRRIHYDPTLVVLESYLHISQKDASNLDDPLVRQTESARLLSKMRTWLQNLSTSGYGAALPDFNQMPASRNLSSAYAAGVPLVLGTDSGNGGVFPGPAVHREIELWKNAGIPAADILKAATYNNAVLLGVGDRIGKIAQGYDASFILIDGNPLQDVTLTRRLSDVFFKGERIRRSELFETTP